VGGRLTDDMACLLARLVRNNHPLHALARCPAPVVKNSFLR
jgi:hypothetical protein